MTQPHDGAQDQDMLDLAVPYAFHALPDGERDDDGDRNGEDGDAAFGLAGGHDVRPFRRTRRVRAP